ncbi:unnamed protein product [Alopecurus aequalis]
MQHARTTVRAVLPEGATALEIPSDRPASVKSFKRSAIIPATTGIRLVIPPSSSESRAPRPESATVYARPSSPYRDLEQDAPRTAYAYITPDTSPCRADPGPFIRLVFRTLALDLPQTFEILRPRFDADAAVRFRTHAEREAAMRRQPFELDGATVELVPFRVVLLRDVSRAGNGYMVHVVLHGYPAEQRAQKEVDDHCCRFGFVREIDPAYFAAPDLPIVLQLKHPREIPRELCIEYDNGLASVVPVEILSVWDSSKSFDANGRYMPLLQPPRRGGLMAGRMLGWLGG